MIRYNPQYRLPNREPPMPADDPVTVWIGQLQDGDAAAGLGGRAGCGAGEYRGDQPRGNGTA